jgi:ubiquinone/menaquinone biosynthesis C-methylase UbiE
MNLDTGNANADQIRYWNEVAGPRWIRFQRAIDAQIGSLGERAMDRLGVARGERAIDVGCGCGATTLELGRRVGPGGAVLGIDVSAGMIQRGREAAAREGLRQVVFENADAQTYRFERGAFDLVYSRFGVMFFSDPEAALANLRSALKPGGRLGFVCWQALSENPWVRVPLEAAARHVTLPPPAAPGAPGPFSLADPTRVRQILSASGFREISLEDVRGEVAVGGGADLDGAVEFLLEIGPTRAAVAEAPPEILERVRRAIREALEPFATPEGIRLGSAAWIVMAAAAGAG